MVRSTRRKAAAVATKRAKTEDSEESEWEEENDDESPDDDDESLFEDEDAEEDSGDEDSSFEEEKPPKPTKKSVSSPSKKKKRKRPELVNSSDEEDVLPSSARKTQRGGYAHTKKSRSKISRANRGNTPWNKGRNRSEADKAKIGAGVRARFRTRLLRKLGKLGMTEEEYLQKRKEIKHLRERVRKARLVTSKRDAKKKSRQQNISVKEEREELGETLLGDEPDDDDGAAADDGNEGAAGEVDNVSSTQLPAMFAPDIEWARHEFDNDEEGAYKDRCPIGGPGGLICCESCVASYSQYMNQTSLDMEAQKTDKVKKDIDEMLGFMKESQNALQQNTRAARRQSPPTSTVIKGLGPTARV